MTNDTLSLVERLRDPNYEGAFQHLRSSDEIDSLFKQAASRIEHLEAENAGLRFGRDEAARLMNEFAAEATRAEFLLALMAACAENAIGSALSDWVEARDQASLYRKALEEIAGLDGLGLERRGKEIARQALGDGGGEDSSRDHDPTTCAAMGSQATSTEQGGEA